MVWLLEDVVDEELNDVVCENISHVVLYSTSHLSNSNHNFIHFSARTHRSSLCGLKASTTVR